MSFARLNHPYCNNAGGGVQNSDRQKLAVLFANYHLKFLSQAKFSNVDEERKKVMLEDLHKSVVSTIAFGAEAVESTDKASFPYSASCTDEILTKGGDDRITIAWDHPVHRINRYFCSTVPNDDVIRRGSCTCSTMNMNDYMVAEEERLTALESLLLGTEHQWLDMAMVNIRQRLLLLLGFAPDDQAADVVLVPSGTDSEYLPLCVARAILGHSKGGKIVNIITAAGEVGSGTELAAAGRYFSTLSPSGDATILAERVVGFDGVAEEVRRFPARIAATGAAAVNDDAIRREVASLLGSDASCAVILHCVACSKTGLTQPSDQLVQELTEEHKERLLVVVDACQFRQEPAAIASFVHRGFIVLLTGSKFYCAPPFCGAVVLPRALMTILEAHGRVPEGMEKFLSRHELPYALTNLRESFAEGRWGNLGLCLRWTIAIHNMEAVQALEGYQEFPRFWVDSLEGIIREQSPYIRLFPGEPHHAEGVIGGVNSIVSVAIFVNDGHGGVRPTTVAEAKTFHRMMSEGAAPLVHLGQPVTVACGGPTQVSAVLRIALGADMMIECLSSKSPLECHKGIAAVQQQDREVVAKMTRLAMEWAPQHRLHNFSTSSEDCVKLHRKLRRLDEELRLDSSSLLSTSDPSLGTNKVAEVLKLLAAAAAIPPVLIVYDLDCLATSFGSVIKSFEHGSQSFLHCYAIKSCPLSYVLHLAVKSGLGLEAASMGEVIQALRCGCAADKIVFDSPCKTTDEINFALRHGVRINANSFGEIEKIREVVESIRSERSGESACTIGSVGLRINPLVGAGAIAALSTATKSSKFGIPLTPSTKSKIISLFEEHSFLSGLMCHVGSQGMALELLAQGALAVTALAEEIDSTCGAQRVMMIDIGGGLTVNYATDDVTPTFEDYKQAILRAQPTFFSLNANRTIVTEFGKSLVAKAGAVVAEVEDVMHAPNDLCEDRTQVAVVHTGADLFLRTAYCPDSFHHRIEVLDADNNRPDHRSMVSTTVAGPLCFSGDVLLKNKNMCEMRRGDRVVILDAGANTLSLFSRHCSRTSPAVVGFRLTSDRGLLAVCLRSEETTRDMLSFWD